eukprot:sb/3477510/
MAKNWRQLAPIGAQDLKFPFTYYYIGPNNGTRSNATNDDLLRRPKPVIPRGASQPPAKRKNGYNSSTKTPNDLKFCMPPNHISWSNSKFQTQLPTPDHPTILLYRPK